MRYIKDNNKDHMYKLSIEGTGVPMDELSQEEIHVLVCSVDKEEREMNAPHASAQIEQSIDALGLPSRAINALNKVNVLMVREPVALKESDLCKLPYLGKSTIKQVVAILEQNGLQLKK